MSEQALYRKYRPKEFADVRGQEEIVSTLLRSISDKSISHAYLFSGGRGTGKTTVARIFAAEIGCDPVDIYEIDGASNRSIDDIRELRAGVATMPFSSPYKIYIIDEVHMLTKEAFNALLKTLEEPPMHVVFILATTDREKVPETIISRCQTFTFRQPGILELKEYAIEIAKAEKVKLDAPSADIVAMFGDGSYRDTLSVLEKVLISSEGGIIDLDVVARIVGAPTHDLINSVVRSIESGDPTLGLTALVKAREERIDMKVFLKMLLSKMRAVLLLRYAPSMEVTIKDEFPPDDMKLIHELAVSKERRVNSQVLSEFIRASHEIGWSVIPSLPLELALIRVTSEKTQTKV